MFFALKPAASFLHLLAPLWRRARAAGVAPVPLENAHLTLAFIGALSPEECDTASHAGSLIRVPHFDLTLNVTGYWNTGGVIWLGARRPPTPLLDLAADLRQGLIKRALPVPAPPFIPHVTLARHASHPWDPAAWSVHWPVDRFFLLESVAANGIPRYIVRRRYLLQRPSALS